MGAFFLHRCLGADGRTSAKAVFASKGFTEPLLFLADGWEILYYHKLADNKGQAHITGNTAVFAVGTFQCNGKKGNDSLKHILNCFMNHTQDGLTFTGHYTIIVYDGMKWNILMDGLNTKHVFCNQSFSVFSSSMLATASLDTIVFNKDAILEKCLTGLILSPDTLFQGVYELNRAMAEEASEKSGIHIQYQSIPNMQQIEYESGSVSSIAKNRAKTLNHYMEQWKETGSETIVDLGLSGGYDSTLLFALGYNVFNKKLHIHTHSTGHVHDKEKQIAQQICEYRKLDCHIVQTEHFDKMEGNPINLLLENILFFDGRTAPEIGGFSPTYTASYRISATEHSLFTLTGVGGEVYRNPYSLPKLKIHGEDFFKLRICNPFFRQAVQNNETVHEVLIRHLKKAEKTLCIKLTGLVPYTHFRRYYSEIVMPEGQGHVIDAYNTVSQCIAPFLEPAIIYDAYKAIPYIGNTGEFEAAIIQALDNELYHFESSYGYPFSNIPIFEKVKSILRVHTPPLLWNYLSMKKTGNEACEYFAKVCNKCPELKNAYDSLSASMQNVDLEIMMRDPRTMAAVAYIALVMSILSKGGFTK